MLTDPRTWIVAGCLLLLGYLTLTPVAYLFAQTFIGEDAGIPAFQRAFGAYNFGKLLGTSLVYAGGAAFVSTAIGTILAYIAERTDTPFRSLLYAAAILPLVIPAFVYAIIWIWLGSPGSGMINELARPIIGGPLINVFSMPGMIMVESLAGVPFVFLLMAAAFHSMDPSLEESALTSGASVGSVIRRITVPLAAPAVGGSLLIMFVRDLQAFEVPALLGLPDNIVVLTSLIWRVLNVYPVDYSQVGAYSFTLLLMTAVGMFLYTKYWGQRARYATITGRGLRLRALSVGKWRWPLAAVVLFYFLVAVILPIFILIFISTQRTVELFSLEQFLNGTLENYASIFSSPTAMSALTNSLLLGATTGTVVMLFTAVIAWIINRTDVSGRWLADHLTVVPLAFPGIVMGVALLFMYLRFPLPIYGSIWLLLIAYCTIYLPFGMRYANSAAHQLSEELEESAKVSGATWLQTFRRIVIPLLLPGLIAGWAYVFVVASRELSASLLLYSADSEVVATEIWRLWNSGRPNELAALAVVMIVVLSAGAGAAIFVRRFMGIRSGR